MTRLLFLGLNLIFLIPNSFAAVTIIGKEDAALCYQSAELGYTGYSQTQACLRALDDPFLNNRDRSGTHINLGIIFNNPVRFFLKSGNSSSKTAQKTISKQSSKFTVAINYWYRTLSFDPKVKSEFFWLNGSRIPPSENSSL